jgi:hypothetical protein
VSPQAPLTTHATHLASHTLTDYLQLCQCRFQGNPPLQPHHSPFLLVFTHIGGHAGHRTPRSRGVYAAAHEKSPFSRPTKRRCESFGGMEIGTMRLFDASRGGQHSLYRIQDIVEPCGQGHSGRHPTHKREFLADWLTERQGKRRKSREKLRPCLHAPGGGAPGSFSRRNRQHDETYDIVCHAYDIVCRPTMS